METIEISSGMSNPFAKLSDCEILVVDSDPDAREILTVVFETYGARPILASTVDEALAVLEQIQPKLLISELIFPSGDGYALIQHVKAFAAKGKPSIPAIALTVCAKPEDRSKALAAGFREHVAKPYDIEQLLQLIIKLLKD